MVTRGRQLRAVQTKPRARSAPELLLLGRLPPSPPPPPPERLPAPASAAASAGQVRRARRGRVGGGRRAGGPPAAGGGRRAGPQPGPGGARSPRRRAASPRREPPSPKPGTGAPRPGNAGRPGWKLGGCRGRGASRALSGGRRPASPTGRARAPGLRRWARSAAGLSPRRWVVPA